MSTQPNRSKPKILIVMGSLQAGGAERAISRLSAEWNKVAEVVGVIFDTNKQAFSFAGRIIDLNYKPKKGFHRILAILGRILAVSHHLRKEQPDLIISFLSSPNFTALVASLLTYNLNRLFLSIRTDPREVSIADKLLLCTLYRLAKGTTIVSKQGRDTLVANFRFPKGKCFFIPNGIPIVNELDRAAEESPTIVAVGRLSQEKGFDLLIDAMKILNDRGVRPVLNIVGDGPEREALATRAAKYKLDNVIFHGFQQNTEKWFKKSAIYVLPSRFEGWPNSLMEAMNYGCACVAFDCRTGPSELIEHEKSGLLIPPLNTRALADGLESILKDEILLQKFQENARKRIRNFNIQEIATQWLKLGLPANRLRKASIL